MRCNPTHPTRPIMTVVLLAGAVAAPAAAQSSFVLRGIVRDFRSDHPDFGPGHAAGHFAGNVPLTIGDNPPALAGGGFEVTDQWRDSLANPIAPHMFNAGKIIVEVINSPDLDPGTVVDSYDSGSGPYSPGAAGPAPEWVTGAPMPEVIVPTLDVPMTGNFNRNGGGSTMLNGDLHCNNFDIRDGHRVRINGHVQIVVEGAFTMRDGAQLILEPGAECDIYIKGSAGIYDTIVGGPQDTGRMRIYYTGTTDFRLGDAGEISAHITAPSATLKLQDGSQFFGQVRAKSVTLESNAGLHIDDLPTLCDMLIDDSAGGAGGPTSSITSAATFADWFADRMGVNMGRRQVLVMRDTGSGEYLHENDEFYPIDGKLYGNEGAPHNYYFTFETSATFTYNACMDQSIWFEGSDDCWIYVDDRLIIDLGGVEAGTGQYAELDRLGFIDGETYSFKMFYAHRHAGPARFNLRTTFPLVPDPVEAGLGLSDSFD